MNIGGAWSPYATTSMWNHASLPLGGEKQTSRFGTTSSFFLFFFEKANINSMKKKIIKDFKMNTLLTKRIENKSLNFGFF